MRNRMKHENEMALDRNSFRSKDENGYLHVRSSHITKAGVNPYAGWEIPHSRELGLDPDKIYYGLRDPEELQKAIHTWEGLPLHIEHHADSAEDPQIFTRVGAVGSNPVWNDPYVDAALTIWDQNAIDGIEDDSFRALSCAYRYDPDFTPGTYRGQPYDFVMRNIRGNHIALVEKGRAGADVLVADSAPKELNHHQEGFMGKFKQWFKGAQDSDPETERKEVDLAQEIIDLHRRDPVTGEVLDVNEDEDRASELRAVVEELVKQAPPELAGKLAGVMRGLRATKAEGADMNGEEKNMHADAMRAAGCDAADPDEAKAFAGGVKYGEALERNPEERAKLDREHESEGMKQAMDGCGVDAENPAETKAFAEGVRYGEEVARRKADAGKEPEPTGDEDKNAMIDKILAVPGLTEEQKKAIRDTLSDLAYAPATGDADAGKKFAGAADAALRRGKFLGATDAALIRAQAASDAMACLREKMEAARRVRPLVGEVDPFAYDSANAIYGHTLEQCGKRPERYDRKAWKGMVEMLAENHSALAREVSIMANDSKRLPDSGPFRFLKNISIAE